MGAPVLSSSGQPLVIAVPPGSYVKWEEKGVWVPAFKAMEAPSRRWELGQSLGDEAAPPGENPGEMPSPGGALQLPPFSFCSWPSHTSLLFLSFFSFFFY